MFMQQDDVSRHDSPATAHKSFSLFVYSGQSYPDVSVFEMHPQY